MQLFTNEALVLERTHKVPELIKISVLPRRGLHSIRYYLVSEVIALFLFLPQVSSQTILVMGVPEQTRQFLPSSNSQRHAMPTCCSPRSFVGLSPLRAQPS